MKKNIWLLVIGYWLLVAGGRWPVVNAQTYDHSAGTSYPSFRIGVDPYLDFQPTADTGLVKIELNGYVKYLATKGWVLQHIATGSGIKHLNGLSDSTQTFAIDTSGTDFAITSASTIHTFKLPFATAVNHGKLRSTDWTKFNNKENALTFSYPLVRTVNAISLSYNSTNLKQTSNQLNTIQDIATTSSPTFSNVTATNDLTAGFVNSNLIPKLTDTYDLGSSTKLWRKGWLSEMEAILFAKETITLLGGWFYVTKDAGTLPADVNTSQTTIDFGKAMTTNDFIVFRQPLTVEYMQVGSLYSGTTYYVTRNLDGSGANNWSAGSPFAVLGYNGNGRIELNAYSTPRLSMITQGATYNSQTEYIRIGDLNGMPGYSTQTWGLYLGTTDSYLKWDAANGLVLKGEGSGITNINGGNLQTNTVTLTKLNFTPVQTSNVVASINASAEGLTINGSKIQINGSTTFASGYDPTTKTTSSDVTTIIGNTVTTSYLNAKNITALGAVTAATFSLGSGAFGVDANGKLTSTSASIAGWDVNSNSIFKINSGTGIELSTATSKTVTTGFSVWNPTAPKMFIGNSTSSMDWNNTTANILTIKGELLSSKFSTSTTFDGTTEGAIISGYTFQSERWVNSGATLYSSFLYPERAQWGSFDVSTSAVNALISLNGYGTDPHITVSKTTSDPSIIIYNDRITIGTYNVPKYHGILASAPSVKNDGDYFIESGTGKLVVWSGSSWIFYFPN